MVLVRPSVLVSLLLFHVVVDHGVMSFDFNRRQLVASVDQKQTLATSVASPEEAKHPTNNDAGLTVDRHDDRDMITLDTILVSLLFVPLASGLFMPKTWAVRKWARNCDLWVSIPFLVASIKLLPGTLRRNQQMYPDREILFSSSTTRVTLFLFICSLTGLLLTVIGTLQFSEPIRRNLIPISMCANLVVKGVRSIEIQSDGSLVLYRYFLPRLEFGPIQAVYDDSSRRGSVWVYDFGLHGRSVTVDCGSGERVTVAPSDIAGFLESVAAVIESTT